jgi:hypothetical protein
MPGLNAVIRFNNGPGQDSKRLSAILNSMDYGPSYSHEDIYSDPRTNIYFSGYKGYPRQKIEIGDKTLIIEGAIYNKSHEQVKNELAKILPSLIANTDKTEPLRVFMFNTDGEFIIYYIDNAASTVIIFNDALGRLPAYVQTDNGGLILARVMKFMTGLLPAAEFDEKSLMEYFLFSVPLGNKTFFKNIYRLLPCSLLMINLKTGQVNQQQLHRYNFDDRWDDRPAEEYVRNLHDLFLKGLGNRVSQFKDRKQILSLSGGLDSRANLMGLLKLGIDFEAITFRDFYNLLARDYPVVQTLQKMYNFKLKPFNLIEENIPDFERMVFLKDGTSNMGTMGSVLNSMEVIEKEYGPDTVFYTGDEGNYITAPRYGGKRIDSIPDLVKEILLKNSVGVYSIDEVAAIFGKKPGEVMDNLCDYYSSYPEKDNLHKMDHFFLWERSFKFTMEGQDRIRLFFWPIAPHYSIQYARYAFQIKNKYLGGWKIYRELLKMLDKRSASVKYANFGIALDSPMMPAYLKMRAVATRNESIRRKALVALRLLKKPTNFSRKAVEWEFIGKFRTYLAEMIKNNSAVGSHFDTSWLLKAVDSEKYLYRMYIPGNLIKYMTFLDGKNEMPGALK